MTTRGEREDRLSAEEAQTWRGFLEAHARAVALLDRALAESGCALDLREYDLLVHLSEAGEGGLRLRDLAARALINRSNVTRRVETLVERGFVERLPDPLDGRGVFARLSPAGRQALRRASAVHIPSVKRLVFRDTGLDLAAVRRFFDGICAEALVPPPSPPPPPRKARRKSGARQGQPNPGPPTADRPFPRREGI